jgi:hypothetical protein
MIYPKKEKKYYIIFANHLCGGKCFIISRLLWAYYEISKQELFDTLILSFCVIRTQHEKKKIQIYDQRN